MQLELTVMEIAISPVMIKKKNKTHKKIKKLALL